MAQLQPLGYDATWVKNHVSDEPTFLAVTGAGLLSGLLDIPKFAKGCAKLRGNAWQLVDHGEKPAVAFAVRQAIDGAGLAPLSSSEGAAPVTTEEFAAWNLWQVHKSALWLPVSKLAMHCTRVRLDPKEVFKFVRRSKTDSKQCLYHRLHEDLLDIDRMLQAAVVMPSTVRPAGSLDATQNEAVRVMCESAVAFLQGGAGVGKTTTTSHMISSIQSHVACLAFTHKAKRCLAAKIEAAGLAAKVEVATIHAFVNKYKSPDAFAPPVTVVVDECSMVDVELLATLARVLLLKFSRGYSLKFIGDKAQLPPIGRGEFFRERVDKGEDVVELTKCYRTDKPDLFEAYQSIRHGQMPPSTDNFRVLTCKDDREINSKVGALINLHGKAVQFIAWQNKDVWKINKWVQERRLARGEVGPERWRNFCTGDPVIYVGENGEFLTNAMVGEVTACAMHSMTVLWEDGQSTTVASESAVALRYCITVHKSQGSEYRDVVVPCYDAAKMAKCLDRRWLYTAVTRGQSSVVMLCTEDFRVN